MVTIQHKNLPAGCLFLLGYSPFFLLLAVPGSYDYRASGVLASKLEPSGLGKYYNDWLSNHQQDHHSLEGNYESRKSRSTFEEEAPYPDETWDERKTVSDARENTATRRKRRFEISVGAESIAHAAESILKDAVETGVELKEDIDAVKNGIADDKTKQIDINSKNEAKKEEVAKDGEKGEEEKNALDISGRILTDGVLPSGRFNAYLSIPHSDVVAGVVRKKSRKRHGRKKVKVGGRMTFAAINDEDEDDDDDDDDDDYEEDYEEEDDQKEEEEEDYEKDGNDEEENEETGVNTVTELQGEQENQKDSKTTMELLKLLSDTLSARQQNLPDGVAVGLFPWGALTSSKYTRKVTKQEGPHLKHTTKETKSRVKMFFANSNSNMLKVAKNDEPESEETNPMKDTEDLSTTEDTEDLSTTEDTTDLSMTEDTTDLSTLEDIDDLSTPEDTKDPSTLEDIDDSPTPNDIKEQTEPLVEETIAQPSGTTMGQPVETTENQPEKEITSQVEKINESEPTDTISNSQMEVTARQPVGVSAEKENVGQAETCVEKSDKPKEHEKNQDRTQEIYYTTVVLLPEILQLYYQPVLVRYEPREYIIWY